MKKLFLLLILSFFSAQSFAGSCPDGSDPVKSLSADGTYFVYNCGGDSNNSQKSTQVKVKASDINFPGKFYTTEIESCKAMAGTPTFNSNSSIEFVEGLIGYDWHADWEANSNSMNVYHQKITGPIKIFMSATHNAIGNDNQANIKIAKNLLIDLAKVDTLYDSIGYIDVKKKPMCYAGGDINSPCWYHEYQFASNVFSNYMITALWLKDELNEQEFKIVDKYIKKMYKKFLKPIEFHKEEQGFYAMANGGTSILVYASWTNNTKLAAEEINHRFQEMDRLFYEDGYINNNSFRGYRGQWYHSYGLDIALGYVYIADLWGAEVPEKLHNKLVKASKVANLAITDWDQFKSRKYGGAQSNAIEDPKNAIKHTHQMAIAIDTLMKIVTGVELEHDAVYLQKRKYHTKDGIDDLIGFNPNCTLEALALANNPEELAKQDAKRIKVASELSIFEIDGERFNLALDKVDFSETGPFELEREEEGYLMPFQLHKGHINGYLNTKSNGIKKFRTLVYKYADTEEQKLVIHLDDPTIKPLKRHKDSLQKLKCGFDEFGWDWLNFISQTNNSKSARNQQCIYDYFKEANDSEAWELFQAVLGGTDSILDYLETNVVATKEEEKRIPADLEPPIFDDVEYKLEGQILKINIRDPKMKPLMRHIGGLTMKCGSGLIDTKSGWISFVSSDSNSRNQQCHYDYFQKSNDSEALELFKAVLSGTDSILDYLETNVEP